MSFLYNTFRKLAFKFDPELVHEGSILLFSNYPKLFAKMFKEINESDLVSVSGKNMTWPSPIGLAAGFDKDGLALPFFSRLGFGSIEVGTVTPIPQPGNQTPRIFRIPEEESLRNSMGFPSQGMDQVYKNISMHKKGISKIGINLGKNKLTPNEEAYKDYKKLYEKFKDIADYLVINVSSPNTPGLRELQDANYLSNLFDKLSDLRVDEKTPLYLKIAPDMELASVDQIVEVARSYNLAGIVATNTTIIESYGSGGVSGKLLFKKSKIVRDHLLEKTKNDQLDIIGVGGFSYPEDFLDFWNKGGKFIQVYSPFVYRGPVIIKDAVDTWKSA